MVTQATKAKQAGDLLDLYALLFEESYGAKPSLNRYRDKWGLVDVIDSVGVAKAKELLIFYFKTGKQGHPLQFFLFNFDKLEVGMKEAEKDESDKARLRRLTEERVKAFREQQRRESDNSSLPE